MLIVGPPAARRCRYADAIVDGIFDALLGGVIEAPPFVSVKAPRFANCTNDGFYLVIFPLVRGEQLDAVGEVVTERRGEQTWTDRWFHACVIHPHYRDRRALSVATS